MAAAAPPVQTMEQALIACGVPDDGILFNGSTKAERIANDIFDDDFNSCLDVSFDDFDSECKTYSGLTINQGQIRLTPGTKRNIKALIQWSRDKIIIGVDPSSMLFPVVQAMTYIRRYKMHQQFISKSKTISDAAKPAKFSSDSKWIDWYPSFLNFLRSIPGVRGVPLSYVVRDNAEPIAAEDDGADFLTNYVNMARHQGNHFELDNLEVHTYIVHFVAGNEVAEAKLTAHGQVNDGRADYLALKEHFEGVGVNALEITRAERVINSLFYAGEKKPHMWWSEFEKELSRAFAIYDRSEGRVVHSNEMKLRILLPKVTADFLRQAKAALNVELSKVPMTLTYEEAMATFRNAVNQKHPPNVGSANVRTRRINEVGRFTRHNGGGRNNNTYGGRGRHYANNNRGGGRRHRFGRGRNGGKGGGRNHNNRRKTRPDSWWAIGESSGRVIECHPKISYPNDIWYEIPREDRDKITNLRQQLNNRNNSSSTAASVISEISHGTTVINGQQYSLVPTSNSVQHQIQQTNTITNPPPLPPPPPPAAAVSYQPPSHVSIMGGRNEQANLRSCNQNS